MTDGKLADYLTGVELRAENVRNCPEEAMDSLWRSVHRRSARDVPRLLAALDAVLAIHQRRPWKGSTVCGDACIRCVETWPCAEVRAITAALLGEETADA